MDTLQFIIDRYNLDITKADQTKPIELPCPRTTELPLIFKELGFKSGAEIGVLRGQFSEILCKSNPDMTVYSVDKWEYYRLRNNFRKAHHYPPIFEEASARLSQYPNSRIVREWSQDALAQFPDESLDFVFIDANHEFLHIANDIAGWSKKVRKGGIISGHDYGRVNDRKHTWCHVKSVVDAWAYSHGIFPWFFLKDKDARSEGSWMWIKE